MPTDPVAKWPTRKSPNLNVEGSLDAGSLYVGGNSGFNGQAHLYGDTSTYKTLQSRPWDWVSTAVDIRTQGSTTKSLKITDGRDNSVVLQIDTDGNWTGTSPATSWKSFTPTLSGTGWTLGNGSISGRYTRIGNTVSFAVLVIFGSTSTYGSVAPRLSICPPGVTTNSSTYVNKRSSFPATYFDINTDNVYTGRGQIHTDNASVNLKLDGAPMTNVTSTSPFTMASGSSLSVCGTYEAVQV